MPYLAAAAAEARRLGALDEAAGFLAEGIALAPPPGAEAELWLGLADVHAWRGDREALDAAFARARALLEEGGDPAALAAAWAARGRWLRTSICYPRESLEAYRTALGLLEGGVDAPEVEVLARAGSAWAESVAGDPERAEADIAALEARPDAAHDPVLAAELALDRTMAMIRAGRLAEADEQGLRAAALALAAGRPELASVAFGNIAAAAAARGDFARCLELVERAAGPDERVGPGLAAHLHAARAHALSRLGRHAEAVAAARAQEALAARAGAEDLEATAAFDLGCVLLAAGEPRRPPSASGSRSRPATPTSRARSPACCGRRRSRPPATPRPPRRRSGASRSSRWAPATCPRRCWGGCRAPRPSSRWPAASPSGRCAAWTRRSGSGAGGWRPPPRATCSPPWSPTSAGRRWPGLVEPAVELGLTLADRAEALAALGRLEEAQAAAREAAALADETGFDGYRERLVGDARVL